MGCPHQEEETARKPDSVTSETTSGANAEKGNKGKKKERNECESDEHSTGNLSHTAQLAKLGIVTGKKVVLPKKDITS